MEWIEALPLPQTCVGCEEDCGSCNTAGERWVLSEKTELLVRKKAAQKAMERILRDLADIDRRLEQITDIEQK